MREAANKEGRTVLYVSHNMNTIRQLCDRCIVLDKGKIVFDGDVEEAIEVYMGVSVDLKCHYEYTEEFHTQKGTKAVYLRELHIENCKQSITHIGGSFALSIRCDVRHPSNQVKFRFEIQYSDGTVAATAFTERGIDFLQSGTAIIKLCFSAAHLAPGSYKADLVAYCTDSFGNDVYIDGVIPALYFEVAVDDEIDESSKWLHKYWGHVRLNDVIVLD